LLSAHYLLFMSALKKQLIYMQMYNGLSGI